MQVYSIENSPLCLTGTAEVPLAGIYMDQILSEAQLPIKMVAFGHAFRTEAGASGASSRGLYRVHQFSKVGVKLCPFRVIMAAGWVGIEALPPV